LFQDLRNQTGGDSHRKGRDDSGSGKLGGEGLITLFIGVSGKAKKYSPRYTNLDGRRFAQNKVYSGGGQLQRYGRCKMGTLLRKKESLSGLGNGCAFCSTGFLL